MNWLEMEDEAPLETREPEELNLAAVTRRVWEGWVDGRPDCWVLVPRDEADLEEWLYSEASATEVVPLRVCRELSDDGRVVLSGTDPGDDALSPDDHGW
jgi:hypothetical protein